MECNKIIYSGHAVRRMFERALNKDAVKQVIQGGEVIAAYPDDTPYPSYLMLGFDNEVAIHVVASKDGVTGNCYVITVYQPDPALWESDFRTRRS
jgi:hypothetical protein